MENLILEKEELEVASFNLPQVKALKTNESNDDILFIVLLNKNANFAAVKNPYDIEIYGKKMWEWVALAGDGCEVKTIVCTDDTDVVTIIRPYLSSAKYTAVFYSDTPLFTKTSFLEIMDYFENKNLNVLKLSRGFVFKTEYIKQADSIQAANIKYFNETEFITIYDFKQLALVSEMIKNRIIDYHMKSGVFICDPLTTYIDADVIIETGVKIEPNVSIKGLSIISKNCEIGSGSIIKNSIISENTIIRVSYIEESRVSENMIVGPYESVIKKSV